MVYFVGAQRMLMSVTLVVVTVPDPALTTQVCPAGWVPIVTLYELPAATALANVKEEFALTVIESALLSVSTIEVLAVRPATVPPMV
jgi:hypothetical protein